MKLTKQWGALPDHSNDKEKTQMIVKSELRILNKKEGQYTAKDGSPRVSHKITYSQNDDDIVGEMSMRKEVFDSISKGGLFEVTFEYLTTKNGNYLSALNAKAINTNNKGTI